MTTWQLRTFAELATAELYAIVELRERVFVVEQDCAYLDADGVDRVSRHLWTTRDGAIVAYLRIVPAGVKYPEVSLGRVVIAPELRGTGLGRELVQEGIAAAGNVAIRIAAQAHLQRFYAELGWQAVSEIYVEDGIPHVEMLRPAGT